MFGTTSCRGMMGPNRRCESSRVISPLAELNLQLYLKVIVSLRNRAAGRRGR